MPTPPRGSKPSYTTIIVAIDDDDPEAVCRRADQLALQFDASVLLVNVVEPFAPMVTPGVMGGATMVTPLEAAEYDKLLEQHRRRLTDIAANMAVENVESKVLESADLGLAIHTEASEQGADLIIVGSHGRHGLALLFNGSTASDMLKASPCDVLAVAI
ncbi:universal stress protein [Arenicella xantha]|uniref:Universal stress protein n=1 Tax=Arenicella xantha TaxID=644221 RepID=A0A395JNZ7_9GAMM|nr:universal stress protein [Arenicella xantha]RBP53043.1 universal stress protein A [Arenicella xantha]